MRLSIIYICLIFICLKQVLATNKIISKQYGVGTEELEYYKDGSKYFNCLRSNIQIPFSQVNDDFCDCPDGTDEPGTSACSNGHFYCKNIGNKGAFISSSYVNDDVCDCCDGSDEYSSKTTCINNCNELGAENRKKQQQLIESYQNGLKKKKEMELEGTKLFNEKTDEIIRIRKEIDPITQEIKELEVLIENKKLERETENKRLQQEKEERDKLNPPKEQQEQEKEKVVVEQQKQQEDDGEQQKDVETEILKTEKVDEVQTSELLEAITKGKDLDSITITSSLTTIETPNNDNNNNDNKNNNDIIQVDNDIIIEEDKKELTTQPPTITTTQEEDTLEDISITTKIFKPIQSIYNDIYKFVVPYLPNGLVSYKDMDLGGLENELSRKRESLKSKENEIEKIDKMIKSDLGVNNVFLPMYGKCYDLQTKEYTYTVCPYDKASQGHTSLGRFENWSENHNQMNFENGQQCWGGPKRSIKVFCECGHENELYDVQEPGKCEYTIKFKTPSLCNEEHLKVLQLENDHSL